MQRMHKTFFFSIKLFAMPYKRNININLEASFLAITRYTYDKGGTMNKAILPGGTPTHIIQKAKR
jgi:hypothetical protein